MALPAKGQKAKSPPPAAGGQNQTFSSWDDSASADKLLVALESGNDREAARLVDICLNHIRANKEATPLEPIGKVIDHLRSYVKPELLVEVAETLFKSFPSDHIILRTKYPQALIDSGEIAKAIEYLKESEQTLSMGKKGSKAKKDLIETRGLLGRAYKQLYVDAKPNTSEPRQYDLDNAVRYYGNTYKENKDSYWHGINFVACKTHASRLKKRDAKFIPKSAKEACREILEHPKINSSAWGIATQAEAHLALGNFDKAANLLHEYVNHSETDRFMINGTLRQIIELWKLDPQTAPGDKIIPILQGRLIQVGRVDFPANQSASTLKRLQKVFDENTPYREIDWLKTALRRSQSVARLGSSLFTGDGTGFVFDGGVIGPHFKNRNLLMTNAHVCTNDNKLRTFLRQQARIEPLLPSDVVVGFLGVESNGSGPRPIRVKRLLYTSPPAMFAQSTGDGQKGYDATLLELVAIPTEAPPLSVVGEGSSVQINDRVNVIGYPKGRTLSVSIQDNQVSQVDRKHLWYRAPTDPGSSGSPVFDQDWNVVGLHHSFSPEHQANEGIQIQRIIEDMRRKLQAN